MVKRKNAHVHSEKMILEDNVDDIPDEILQEIIMKRIKTVVGGKKLPQNIPPISLENIFFHFEENFIK